MISTILKTSSSGETEHSISNAVLFTPPTTPTTLSSSVHTLLAEIREIHHSLIQLSSLTPGQEINALLTRLVNLSIIPYGSEFEDHFLSIEGVGKLCQDLQAICGRAEGELEGWWVNKMLHDTSSFKPNTNPRSILHQFPYYNNYINLSRLETCLLAAFLSPSISKINIAFIGSGPLPLSSFCLFDAFPNATVYNIDRDISALKASQALAHKIEMQNSMKFIHEDITNNQSASINWQAMDVVFLAALVGMDVSAKMEILGGLRAKLREGCLVIARSARGLRRVLYPVLELSSGLGEMGYEVLAELHPHTDVVNSVVVLRVKTL